MNFRRMGEVGVSEVMLRPAHELEIDDSFLPFEILNLGILSKAHFYDNVCKAYIFVYSTYKVIIRCIMQSGYKTEMLGSCTPTELLALKAYGGSEE